tara:strand:- start:472 stop:1002 length:531 start_codon:yes stop_codon:yes gene_type:complete
MDKVRLRVIPLPLADANLVVSAIHRHHKKVLRHRFSLACIDDAGTVRGVAICGRPVARMTNGDMVIEVARVATDGTRNACSFLLGACARTAKAMGFGQIQTYTLPEEGGASLRGAGWDRIRETRPRGPWKHTDGRPRDQTVRIAAKTLWRKDLNVFRDYILPAVAIPETDQLVLFG